MPIYHFHVGDQRDLRGTELADVATAQSEALKLAGMLIRDELPGRFWDDGEWTMNVSAPDNLMLFQLVLMGVRAPAGERMRVLAPTQ